MRTSVLVAVLALILMSYADAQIPTVEREALIALYNSTDGANWSDNTNWLGAVDTECTWFGVTCDLGHVDSLNLSGNQLNGEIPPELGNLSSLKGLILGGNQVSGIIPPELGNLSNLVWLAVNHNRLSGVIPTELGNLSNLQILNLCQNQLNGNIPAKLETLLTLEDGESDLRWNALHSNIVSLVKFLNNKQNGGDWQSTQTIAPANLTVDSLGDHTVWLSWDAVTYQSDPGGYEVFSTPTGSGVWTSVGWTEAKTDTTFPITGLDPGTTYDLAVVSYTDPHVRNLNLLISDLSPQVMVTTASTGCAQPIIEMAGVDPITLSVLGSYDGHLWSTGEVTSSIVVSPYFKRWYLVTVTSAGPCEETAAILIDPSAPIFADGFESGDTSEWSSKVP